MAEVEITEFLSFLAREGKVAVSTQNQALSALLFLYKEVLRQEIGWLDQVERVKRPARLPVVSTKDEVGKIFAYLHGTHRLMAGLLYGSGLRLMECVRLRVKDVDFGYSQVLVREGKGGKDRITMLPVNLARPLERHLQKIKAQHEEDLEAGFGSVYLPSALEAEVSQRTAGMALAVCLSFGSNFNGPSLTGEAAPSCGGEFIAIGGEKGGACFGYRQTGHVSLAPALVRNASARKRVRYTHPPGTSRSQGCEHDHDLHACPQ